MKQKSQKHISTVVATVLGLEAFALYWHPDEGPCEAAGATVGPA